MPLPALLSSIYGARPLAPQTSSPLQMDAASTPLPYDEALAVHDLWLHQAASCSASDLTQWSCGLACDNAPTLARLVADDPVLTTRAVVARTGASECTVMFRGTVGPINTLLDVLVAQTALPSEPDVLVHAGFFEGYNSLRPHVLADLETLDCANSTLAIAGHSFGGAVASLFAYDVAGALSHLAPTTADAVAADALSTAPCTSLSRLYTYGQPRTGNHAFADNLEARLSSLSVPHWRIVQFRDPVAQVPPADALGQGWAHSGPEIYYSETREGAYTACAAPDDAACSARWGGLQLVNDDVCFHCSYVGLNPCACGATTPECTVP